MNRLLAALALLTFAVVFTGLFWWLRGADTPVAAGQTPTHMHCPDCQLEVRYEPGMDGRSCPHCGPSGPKMIGTVGSFQNNRDAPHASKMSTALAAATIALVLVQAWLYGTVLYARARRRAREADQQRPLVCRCPFCERKIGYPRSKIGMPATCARCKTVFPLPATTLVEEAS